MKPVDPKQYFNERAAGAGEGYLVSIVKLRRILKGDAIDPNAGLSTITRARENGWLINIGDSYGKFMNDSEFRAIAGKLDPVEIEKLSPLRKSLPRDANVRRVEKGQMITTQPMRGVHMRTQAERPGWLLKLDGRECFMSDLDFRLMFNTAAKSIDDSEGLYRLKSEKGRLLRYIETGEGVTFQFLRGPATAGAGNILIENPDDEDGYTLDSGQSFMVARPAQRKPRDPSEPEPSLFLPPKPRK
jgi:hypothetical protein